jgi:tetratricopeptide (TPR) repeat protein
MEIERPRKLSSEEINQALSRWNIPEIPGNSLDKARLANWLYDLVKQNVKRGSIFQLEDVLLYQQADCLGYAKLLSHLGKRFALDIGIVEVVIDNAGRYTPHYVNLVKLSRRNWQFMDLWYGARNARHHRIGAQVKEKGKWGIKDLDWNELKEVENIRGLPEKAVDGITYYILGNRHLEKGIQEADREELDRAIAHYTKAVELYQGYARAYFNRAIAYENEGEYEKASSDYAQALRDESSQVRVLAREHEDVVGLMELDRANIGMREQEIYLLRKGFISGKQIPSSEIAKHYGISESEVGKIISAIEAQLVAISECQC